MPNLVKDFAKSVTEILNTELKALMAEIVFPECEVVWPKVAQALARDRVIE